MGMSAEAYLDDLAKVIGRDAQDRVAQLEAELEATRMEAATYRREATRWRQEAERLLHSPRPEEVSA